MADGGRRKKEAKPRDGGALGVLIGQGAPGRGEQRLGRSIWPWATQRRAGGAGSGAAHGGGGVAARERVWDACARGKVPRGGPGGAGGLPGSIWPRTRHGRGHRRRTAGGGETEQAGRREMEIRAYLRFLKFQLSLGNLKISPTRGLK